MDPYWLDWANLLLRWAHVVTAIAWIGASFYFVGLDNGLRPPADPKDAAKGVGGEQWAVHGGGFYHQQKYPVSPGVLPERLHWSLWESYSTWLTGFALFAVLYLFNARTFLIDPQVFDWSPAAAIATALAFLVLFWVIYDAICRLFGGHGRAPARGGDATVGALVSLFVVFAAWLSCQLFAGRAAFLLVGAMLATTMSANVLMVIIPGQRKVIAALREGRAPDPVHGKRGKQRSVHNTYFTLPVVFAMLSNHYGFLYTGAWNWLVLVALMLAGASIRLSFVLRHKAKADGRPVPWRWAILGALAIAILAVVARPAPTPGVGAAATPATFADVQAIVGQRCVACHAGEAAQKGVRLDAPEAIRRHAQAIQQQVVVQKTMPLANATGMTEAERATIARWFAAGAR